jgi:hypothetical protein
MRLWSTLYEDARVDRRTALGGIASRGATTTTAAWRWRSYKQSTLPNTGVICQELMTATFCNVTTSPNDGGYGSGAGAASSKTGISPAIPPCASFPPANELCN